MYSKAFCKVYNEFGWNYFPEAFGEQLLIWLERNMRRRRAGRKPGETARAFLIRIREEQLPQCGDALVQLADCLDAHYFGAGRDISHREAAALRRMLARELRQRGTRRSRGEQR